MKRLFAFLVALFGGLIFVCLSLALYQTGLDEKFVLDKKTVYLAFALLDVLILATVFLIEWLIRGQRS